MSQIIIHRGSGGSSGGGGGMAVGGAVTGGTVGRVLYVGAGPVLADDAGMTYNAATDTLTVGGAVVTPKHQFPSGYFLWEIFGGTFTLSGGLNLPSVAFVVGVGQGEIDVYNNYTDISNFERGFARWSANVFTIGTEAAGTGTVRDMQIGAFRFIAGSGYSQIYGAGDTYIGSQSGGGNLYLVAFGVAMWVVDVNTGGFRPNTDNTEDLGSAATRVRRMYVGTSTVMSSVTDQAAPAAGTGVFYFRTNGGGKMEFCVRFPTGAIQVIATEP